MVKLVAQGQKFNIDQKMNGITNYFKDLIELQGNKQEFGLQTFKKEDVTRLLEACKIAQYSFKHVEKVNQNDASAYISGPLSQYFSTLTLNDLNSLYKLAKHLKVTELQNNIAAYISAKVHFKMSLQEYNKKRNEFGAKQILSPERSKKLKQKYGFLN